MKRILHFFICAITVLWSSTSFAQVKKDSLPFPKKDSNDTVKPHLTQIPVHPDTVKRKDSTTAIVLIPARKTLSDTAKTETRMVIDEKINASNPDGFVENKWLSRNKFINLKSAPEYFIEQPHPKSGKEFLFYSLCLILLILGIFKTFFTGYFKNLFRVYFNTSLRQTQLADQLEQAKLPSFIMNIFFTITTGMYIWLLFNYYHPPRLINNKLLLPFCILSVAALYFIKFCLLKFMGWVSDIKETTNNYIFAIFLVNKIIGIILVPIVILLAFLNPEWLPVITNVSFMILGLFFLSRYIKSYGAIEKKIPLNPFHFIIYIAAAEIIPLLLIYKIAIDYLI